MRRARARALRVGGSLACRANGGRATATNGGADKKRARILNFARAAPPIAMQKPLGRIERGAIGQLLSVARLRMASRL